MNAYALKQIEEQTSGNIELWISQLQKKYDDELYYFDAAEARKFYTFVSKLQVDKGKKGFIKLLKFQFDICTSILCVKSRITHRKRFREAHINLPRKNGKSFIIACLTTYVYFCKNEFGSSLILASNTTKLAGELYKTIKYMVETNKTLMKHVKIRESRKTMTKKNMNSELFVISSDASNADSFAGLLCILDEIHEAKNGDLYDKLKTGQAIWEEPLLVTITTASSGKDLTNLEMELYTHAKNIEAGKVKDDFFFYAIFEAPKDCKILDETAWFASNPACGVFRKYEDIKALAVRATQTKRSEAAFRRLCLNQHVAMDIDGAIDMNLWNNCLADVKLEDLQGLPHWSGLDMGAVRDITAYVQCFYDSQRDKYIIYPHLFMAKGRVEENSERDNIRYDIWVKDCHIHALDGDYVDFELMHNYIKDLPSSPEEIGFDRWGSIGIVGKLEKEHTVVMLGQKGYTMIPAINTFENLLLEGRLMIANNPVLTWMAGNVTMVNGLYDKKKSKYKIDGIIAMLMAILRAVTNNQEETVDYNNMYEELNAMLNKASK